MDPSPTSEPPAISPPPMDAAPPARQSSWPTAIGIIAIVFGSMGVLCYGCNSASTLMASAMSGMGGQGGTAQANMPPPPTGLVLIAIMFQYCSAWLLAVWQLIAGIGLLRRRAWGRTQLIVWALIKVVVSLIVTGLGVVLAADFVQYLNGQLKPVNMTMTVPVYHIISAVSFLIMMIWPVFVLLWLSRRSVREEANQWAEMSRMTI